MVTTTTAAAGAPPSGPTVTRRRPLPGGRAVVGAFLVVVAALGTFGAYLRATAAPATTYLVADADLPIGHVLSDADVAGSFRAVPIDLPAALSPSAVRAAEADGLVGTTVLAPLTAGDLLRHGDVTAAAAAGVTLSLPVPAERALGGSVATGERLDVLGTYPPDGSLGERTRVVARDVVVIGLGVGSDGLDGARLVLTVQVPDLATAQRLQHAVDIARISLVRGGEGATPPPVTTDEADDPDQAVETGDEVTS